jgi:hypothetical protein
MARKMSLLRALLFSLGIGGALAFGAGTAVAGVGTASTTCAPPPDTYGACLGWYDCKKTCERYGFSGIEAHCVDGCCFCEVN